MLIFFKSISAEDFVEIRVSIESCSLEVSQIYLKGPNRTTITFYRYPEASDNRRERNKE